MKGKNIVLGVTGGIAAYKAAELTREFVKNGASVRVIMTKNAREFVTPLTFQTLSGNPVYEEMFSPIIDFSTVHISLSQYADVVVIAPATANIIGKISAGMADDLLTTTIMATKAPIIICPAMNNNMYENPILKKNISKLKALGYIFLEPGYGELACGTTGYGRMPDTQDIIEEVQSVLTLKDLSNERILITAGPTREPFDPVRYVTNYSTGKMGYAIAIAARRRGAEVTLISGPSTLPVPKGVKLIPTLSAVDMKNAVMENLDSSTIIIKAAAVADYRPASISSSKIKKKSGALRVVFEPNPDIILEVGQIKGDRVLVGFAVETEDLVQNAVAKMISKNMDIIVANDITQEGAGFGWDTNIVKIISRDGDIRELPVMDKLEVANKILDRVREVISERQSF